MGRIALAPSARLPALTVACRALIHPRQLPTYKLAGAPLYKTSNAFDGVFAELRRVLSQRRVLTLETVSEEAPRLVGAELIRTEPGRHEYAFDAERIKH